MRQAVLTSLDVVIKETEHDLEKVFDFGHAAPIDREDVDLVNGQGAH